MREPQGSREDSAPDAHLINFLPDPNAGIGGMIVEGDTGKLSFQGTRYLGFERKDG